MGEFQNNSGFPDISAIMRKSHSKWGSAFAVSRCGAASCVTSSVSNTDSVYTVNFGGGFESQLHFP